MTAHTRSPRQPWTPTENWRLREYLSRGYSFVWIGQHLGRTYGSVQTQATRLGWSQTAITRLYTQTDVAMLFGVQASAVRRWWKRGWLHQARFTHRRYTDETILAFVENVDTWMTWDPTRIIDPEMRSYALECRSAGPQWLTVGEVARYHHVTVRAVWDWVQKGLLPGVVWCNWYCRSDHVAAFVPPCERGNI